MGVILTIDITPEAVERLAACHTVNDTEADTLRALSAALTKAEHLLKMQEIATEMAIVAWDQTVNDLTASQAETAAAYEAAANIVAGEIAALGYHEFSPFLRYKVKSLTPADSKAALDRMIAEARADALFGPWDDKPDALTAAVEAAHPHHTKDYKTYTEALELVSNRHSKGALVGLVNYLLAHNNGLPKGTPHE